MPLEAAVELTLWITGCCFGRGVADAFCGGASFFYAHKDIYWKIRHLFFQAAGPPDFYGIDAGVLAQAEEDAGILG